MGTNMLALISSPSVSSRTSNDPKPNQNFRGCRSTRSRTNEGAPGVAKNGVLQQVLPGAGEFAGARIFPPVCGSANSGETYHVGRIARIEFRPTTPKGIGAMSAFSRRQDQAESGHLVIWPNG